VIELPTAYSLPTEIETRLKRMPAAAAASRRFAQAVEIKETVSAYCR
jgi:hypothetical protein